MKPTVVILLCTLFYFICDAAELTRRNVDLPQLNRENLKVVPIPDTNQMIDFKPLHFLGKFGNFVNLPSQLIIYNGFIRGLDAFQVDYEYDKSDTSNPQKFNVTLRMDKLDYDCDYEFVSLVSNKGHLEGEFRGVRLTIPVETVNGQFKISGTIGYNVKQHTVHYSQGDVLKDMLYNLIYKMFFGMAEDVMNKRYVASWVNSIFDEINKSLK